MKKKFAAMFMAAAMVFTMAACGQKADTPSTPDADGSGDQSGAEVQTFVLGSCGPLTGSAAIYGQAVVNGAELAVEEINASDSTVKFTFLKQDDEADGEKALNAYNTMMDEGMQVLVGPTTTGASLTVSDQTNADRTFMLTPSASSPDVTKDKDNVFQVCFTDPNQGTGAADYIAENMTGAKVAVIYRNDDAYSQGIRDTFVKEAEAKGAFEIVSETTFTADTATFFSNKKLWRFDRNVRMRNINGDRFLTHQLFWDQNLRKIYSDSFIHIERSDRIIEGYGFESNENMTSYKVMRPTASLPTDGFRTEHHPSDTTGG